ncbi:AAA family ATPase [Legionella pneumophila serogroup 8]
MNVEIQNCNNIDSANITITENRLNIKFAHNGTGKSTIAKALLCCSTGDKAALADLLPFKYRESNPDNIKPKVSSESNITNIMCFNEDYVSQFTFQPEELVSNSFDIFIRTDAYKAIEQEITNIVKTIQQQFTNNPELEALISNFNELSGAFKLTTSGELSKTSTGIKGLSVGNKISHIPEGLEPYQQFIQSGKSVNWIDWQTKGHKEFSELSINCPYCSTDSTSKKEQISRVGQEYDKNVIKNLVGIIDVLDKLGEHFSENARENLKAITSLKGGLEKEHENFIVELKNQIDTLLEKLGDIRTLSGFHFKEGEKVAEKLISYKLDLHYLSHLDSVKTQATITSINSSLDKLITQAGELQGKINIQRKEIQKLIKKHQADINGFLAYAGYRYKVKISGEDGKSQLKLMHIDHSQHLSGGIQHLSFGERNAFAIVLFMYECLAKNPELIILDDPISSFDKNKKFAILEMLFRRDGASCLKGKTVVMLTHDIEPIIDTLKSVKKQFTQQVSASYLRYDKGQVYEQSICEKDIKTFAQICQTAINSDCDDIIKLIYLRRHYEIMDDHGDAYQVLSNLFHKRNKPIDSRMDRDGEYPEMDPAKISQGIAEITKKIAGFDYDDMLRKISDVNSLKALYHDCQNGYEKLQVFRLIGIDIENSIIQKFINETYHIENEFICQLDPTQFELIPEYIVDECDKKLQEGE